jgi:hypothetical protein
MDKKRVIAALDALGEEVELFRLLVMAGLPAGVVGEGRGASVVANFHLNQLHHRGTDHSAQNSSAGL